MRAFIVRPFGTKSGIDFDRVEAELIAPALDRLGITGRTTGQIRRQGNIRTDMFQLLAVSDLVVADISIHNANVYYELGMRHGLRDRLTFLLHARVADDDLVAKTDEVPFDLKTDRYLTYDPADPAAALDDLVLGLRETIDARVIDSPAFQLVPRLRSQNVETLFDVPAEFAEEVAEARSGRRTDELAGLSEQLTGRGVDWERGGLKMVADAQRGLGEIEAARASLERVLEIDPDDLEALLDLGTILQRLGELDASDRVLERALDSPALTRDRRAETHALLGRNAKDRWRTTWEEIEDESDRRRAALESPQLQRAIGAYRRGFASDLNHYYSGINALALSTVLCSLAEALPEDWAVQHLSDEEAVRALETARRTRDRLAETVGAALEAATQRGVRSKELPWHLLTIAEHSLLSADPAPARVASLYRRALPKIDDFACDSAVRQLKFYQGLGVRSEGAAAALECLEDELERRRESSSP
jgi:tetratricopeptide (TPR) repeat protein